MITPISDDVKREIRQFAFSCFLAMLPALTAWTVDEVKAKRRPPEPPK